MGERERGREIPAYSIFGRISSPIKCILIVRIKANFSVVRGLINFAPEDNGCQEMCRLTKFLEKARHLLAVQPILPKSLRRTLFFREEFLTAPPRNTKKVLSRCHSPWIDIEIKMTSPNIDETICTNWQTGQTGLSWRHTWM